MNNITKLDRLVHKFVDEIDDLRSERDTAVKKTGDIETELIEAYATINEFKISGKDVQAAPDDDQQIETKKNEIIKQINYIIDSIDSLDLNNITND
jgi:seryl-tRNA synthetase